MSCGTCRLLDPGDPSRSWDPCRFCPDADNPLFARARLRVFRLLADTMDTLRTQLPLDASLSLAPPADPRQALPTDTPTMIRMEITLPAPYGIGVLQGSHGPTISIRRPCLARPPWSALFPGPLARLRTWLTAALRRLVLSPAPHRSSL